MNNQTVATFCPEQCNRECRGECENYYGYKYKNKKRKTCGKWVKEDRSTCDLIDTSKDDKPVSFFCPEQCDSSCIIPTESPTQAPTANCEDTVGFLFEGQAGQDCDTWVRDDPETRCSDESISAACPSVCSEDCRGMCDNSIGYLFEDTPGKDCDTWAREKPKSRCRKKDRKRKDLQVKHFCPLVCMEEYCRTPEECRDELKYKFKGQKRKTCKWAAGKIDNRCGKIDPERDNQPVSVFCPSVCNSDCLPSESPSESPSISLLPSSLPSASPSLLPSGSPTEFCQDTKNYRYSNNFKKTCKWVGKDPIARCAKLDPVRGNQPARNFCPTACVEMCYTDSPSAVPTETTKPSATPTTSPPTAKPTISPQPTPLNCVNDNSYRHRLDNSRSCWNWVRPNRNNCNVMDYRERTTVATFCPLYCNPNCCDRPGAECVTASPTYYPTTTIQPTTTYFPSLPGGGYPWQF